MADMRTAQEKLLIDPITGLPSRPFINEHLQTLIHHEDWAFLDIGIEFFDVFDEIYGFLAGDDVLCMASALIKSVLRELQLSDYFIGHFGEDHFMVTLPGDWAAVTRLKLKERFTQNVGLLNQQLEKEQSMIPPVNELGESVDVPQMRLAIGVVLSSEHKFADIHEVIDLAAHNRRIDQSMMQSRPISLIEERISPLLEQQDWALLGVTICYYETFREVYGLAAAEDIIRSTIKMITAITNKFGSEYNFVDRAAGGHFWIITSIKNAQEIRKKLKDNFAVEVLSHYYYIHKQQGYLFMDDGKKVPLMSLAVGIATPTANGSLESILEMAEKACELEMQASEVSGE